jgi:hypothetical protein
MDNSNQNYSQQGQPQIQQTVIVVGKQKSVGVAFLLSFLFGPLGLLYASVTGGIIMFILGIIIGIITLGFGLILVWIGSIIWAVVAAGNANKKMSSNAGLHINTNFSNPQQNIPQQKPVQQQYQQPATPTIQEAVPITEVPKTIEVKKPVYQSSNNIGDTQKTSFDLGQWFDKNKKSVLIAGGGLVALLLLFVAIKFVFSLDFSKNKDTNQTVNEVQTPLPSTQSNTQTENTPNIQTAQPQQVETTSSVGQNQIGYYIANGSTTTKIYFHNSPDVTTRRKAYLSTQETVYVQKVENGFGYIEFTNSSGQTSYGWVEMQYLIVKPN